MKNYTNYTTSSLGRDFNGEKITDKNINGWVMFNGTIIKKYEVNWMGISFDGSEEEVIPFGALRLVKPLAYETVWIDKNPENGMLNFECANAPIHADAENIEDVIKKSNVMWKEWYQDVIAMTNDKRFVWTGKKGGCLHSNYERGTVTGISCNCPSCAMKSQAQDRQTKQVLNKVFKAMGWGDIDADHFYE